jgi:hypothetical protein
MSQAVAANWIVGSTKVWAWWQASLLQCVQCAVCSVCSVCSGLRAQMQGIIKASDKTTVCLFSGGTLFG